MSESTFLCLLAGLAITWLSLWIYMLCSVLSDDLEEVKKQVKELQGRQSADGLNNKQEEKKNETRRKVYH